MGPERVRQLPRRAAGHRHLPPGQPRVSRPDRLDRHRPVGRAGRLSRHAGRHRQPHHDGQRPRDPRLGRRRHRGRGGDARPADLDADPRGGRLQADRRAGRGRHRHRPGADRHPDAAQEGRGGQVRRVLRHRASTTCRSPTARPSPTWRRNTARPAASSRSTTRRCATCASPAATRTRIALVEAYAKEHGFWRGPNYAPVYTDTLELDMGTVVPSIAGPKRPQDRVRARRRRGGVRRRDQAATARRSATRRRPNGTPKAARCRPSTSPATAATTRPGASRARTTASTTASVVIAAITSCTNTSNPYVMIGAGLVARKARALGLTRKPWVKTSLAPGSQVVSEYLDAAGLHRGPRRARLQPRRLRLHDLHRQLRPAARERLQGDRRRATSSRRRCCRATATSRAGSTPTCARTTSPRRRWSSPTRSPAT